MPWSGYLEQGGRMAPVCTYLFQPATEGRYPGLLLLSEIFQVTGPSGALRRCWRATDLR